MRLNTLFFGLSILAMGFAAGCGNAEAKTLTSALKGGGWEEAHPYATVCPPCVDTNGTCDPNTCVLTCKDGFIDCDGDHSNGCECVGAGTVCGGNCQNKVCMPKKAPHAPCNEDCVMSSTCSDALECVGEPAPEGTYCAHPPAGCASAGVCGADGKCACATVQSANAPRPDMTVQVSGGAPDESGCSVSHGSPTGPRAPLLIGLACLLFVRRRRAASR